MYIFILHFSFYIIHFTFNRTGRKIFMNTSYGYRPGKGHFKAIRRVEHRLKNERKTWTAHRDIDNFFDTLNQDLLLNQFSELVDGDELLIKLVALWLRMGLVDKKGRWHNVESGVRQGHVISPLLDEFASKLNIGWIRYADDYLIQDYTKEGVEIADTQIIDFLKDKLSLKVNNNTNAISDIQNGFTFLGVYFCGDKRAIAQHKMDKIQKKIAWLFSEKNPKSLESIVEQLLQMIDGWRRHYGFLNPTDQFSKIQQVIENKFISFASGRIKNGQWSKNLPNIQFPLLIADNDLSAGSKRMKYLWQEALRISNTSQIQEIKKIADKEVSKRRRKYHREHTQNTDLVITTPGYFIGKRSERIIVRKKQQIVSEMPAIRLTGLTIGGKGVSLSSDVVELCISKEIYIH
ncbi:MAG: reverse transcriptase domain-containing protein [bacterium]